MNLEGAKDLLFAATHPLKAAVAWRRQVSVALESSLPPPNSTVEEFPDLTIRDASRLLNDADISEQQRQYLVDLYDAAKGGDRMAFSELAGIAAGGNLHARELFNTIDGMTIGSGTGVNRRVGDDLFEAVTEDMWSVNDRARMARGERPLGRPLHPSD